MEPYALPGEVETTPAAILVVGAESRAREDLSAALTEAGHGVGCASDPGDAAKRLSGSETWDAVLLDHAITGYFEMPAKGERVDLPDAIVRSAAEYMLRVTFPDMQHDCNPPHCGKVQE